jgi:hypothetical protein
VVNTSLNFATITSIRDALFLLVYADAWWNYLAALYPFAVKYTYSRSLEGPEHARFGGYFREVRERFFRQSPRTAPSPAQDDYSCCDYAQHDDTRNPQGKRNRSGKKIKSDRM